MIENSEESTGPVFFLSSVDSGLVTVREVKEFKNYGEPLAILSKGTRDGDKKIVKKR